MFCRTSPVEYPVSICDARIIISLELLRGVDNITVADSLVVSANVMLRWVIGSVSGAFFPEELEEALRTAAFEPVEPHVHIFVGLGDHLVHRRCDRCWAWLCIPLPRALCVGE